MTRLAVMADIHGNLTAFEAILADLSAQGAVDEVWVLGDLAAFGPQPAACVQRVQSLGSEWDEGKVRVIGGNTDRYLVYGTRPMSPAAKDESELVRLAGWQARDTALNWATGQLSFAEYDYLRAICGKELTLQVPCYGPVIGFHGVPGDDEGNALQPDSEDEIALDSLLDREGVLGIGAHTHLRMDRAVGGWRVVNPGSVGMSFSAPGQAEWALLTFDESGLTVDLRRVAYDVTAVLADFETMAHPAPAPFINMGKLNTYA